MLRGFIDYGRILLKQRGVMSEKIIAYKIEEQMSCGNERMSVIYDVILNHEGIRFNS